MLQALNEEIIEERLNRYTAFIYVLCDRDSEFFYASDLKILVEIILRELELYRSGKHSFIQILIRWSTSSFSKFSLLITPKH
jgi:hypothetical protein